MILRNILYLDTEAIDGYISQIDGYICNEETITSNGTKDRGGKVEINLKMLTAKANLENNNTNTSIKNVKITDSAKLNKVLEYLKSENELKYYEKIDKNAWQNICRDDFLELLVTPRLSKMQEMSDMAKKVNNLVNTFQPYMDKDILNKKEKESLSGMEQISNLDDNSMTSCVFNFEDKNYPIVTKLDNNLLKVKIENIKLGCYLLCKVQKKIESGKSIELDEIFEGFKNSTLNREQKRKMPKNLSNPKEVRDSIKGPAFVVIPIAIYR